MLTLLWRDELALTDVARRGLGLGTPIERFLPPLPIFFVDSLLPHES